MMKRVCDVCGSDVDMEFPFTMEGAGKLLVDDTARVKVSIQLSLVRHSKNKAGRPDVCSKCFKNMIKNELFVKVNSL